MRTTLDIDTPILKELKRIQKKRSVSMGRLVSDLLASALRTPSTEAAQKDQPFKWNVKAMGARVDLADRDALYDLMDKDGS